MMKMKTQSPSERLVKEQRKISANIAFLTRSNAESELKRNSMQAAHSFTFSTSERSSTAPETDWWMPATIITKPARGPRELTNQGQDVNGIT
ncbi:hypothetical protein CEXT_128741 [Caerostris extrusa]|uniref:Uncharacterized protein n=1 Tax=Caerostris extrusa TaxID=172846 RepID=A0AAV4R7I4_CAEEX|nr:hypothetical protein CEXT_128741 [Caerostris extrusa]